MRLTFFWTWCDHVHDIRTVRIITAPGTCNMFTLASDFDLVSYILRFTKRI